jgi:hypothetical protein
VQEEGYHVGGEREAKYLRVCAELCKRLKEDHYHENMSGKLIYGRWIDHESGGFHIEARKNGTIVDSEQRRSWFLAAERNRKNDLSYLGKIIGKRMIYWWD